MQANTMQSNRKGRVIHGHSGRAPWQGTTRTQVARHLWQVEDLFASGAVQAHWPDTDEFHVSQAFATFAQHLACTCTCRHHSHARSALKGNKEATTFQVQQHVQEHQ